jgi:hypothetical protein
MEWNAAFHQKGPYTKWREMLPPTSGSDTLFSMMTLLNKGSEVLTGVECSQSWRNMMHPYREEIYKQWSRCYQPPIEVYLLP